MNNFSIVDANGNHYTANPIINVSIKNNKYLIYSVDNSNNNSYLLYASKMIKFNGEIDLINVHLDEDKNMLIKIANIRAQENDEFMSTINSLDNDITVNNIMDIKIENTQMLENGNLLGGFSKKTSYNSDEDAGGRTNKDYKVRTLSKTGYINFWLIVIASIFLSMLSIMLGFKILGY